MEIQKNVRVSFEGVSLPECVWFLGGEGAACLQQSLFSNFWVFSLASARPKVVEVFKNFF